MCLMGSRILVADSTGARLYRVADEFQVRQASRKIPGEEGLKWLRGRLTMTDTLALAELSGLAIRSEDIDRGRELAARYLHGIARKLLRRCPTLFLRHASAACRSAHLRAMNEAASEEPPSPRDIAPV
jgi:hypothetical protein